MIRSMLQGAEVGAVVAALIAIAVSNYPMALANIAFAAYARYARQA